LKEGVLRYNTKWGEIIKNFELIRAKTPEVVSQKLAKLTSGSINDEWERTPTQLKDRYRTLLRTNPGFYF
jgi:hypothetical protein